MLTAEGLSFSYPRADDQVLSGLNHEFAPGTLTALTGPSGRGKSTLLYLLGLLLMPSSGSVLVDGQPASRLPDIKRARLRAQHFGFVFQDAELDPSRTVLDAVCEPALYAGLTRRGAVPRARALLERFGVGERADHRPGEISGGQGQRVAIARALVNDPAIVLADEPTGNLDSASGATVIEALRGLAREGRTVVIATHDDQVVAACDHVVRL